MNGMYMLLWCTWSGLILGDTAGFLDANKDIYIQELSATVFFPRLPSDVKMRVLELAHSFPALLASMSALVQSKVPPHQWFSVLTKNGTDGKSGIKCPWEKQHQGAAQREANQNEANEK